MRRILFSSVLAVVCLTAFAGSPQVPDYSRSMDAVYASAKVLASQAVDGTVVLNHPTTTGKRATGSPDDPDYATYGDCRQSLNALPGKGYNRLSFKAFAQADGPGMLCISLTLNNELTHYINLRNGQWNQCYLELDTMDSGEVSTLTFSSTLKGPAFFPQTDSLKYIIKDIEFQRVKTPVRTSGWQPQPRSIAYSTSGYLPSGKKTAVIGKDLLRWHRHFRVLKDGRTVLRGRIQRVKSSIGRYGKLDFSSLTEAGTYTLAVGRVRTHEFRIAPNLWDDALGKLGNYIHCQRCGDEVPGVHADCHHDLFAHHDGRALPYGGGWHDAGDLSQQTLQTGETAFSLLEAYSSVASNPELAQQLLDEALWGMDFIAACRFADGWRASSMGLLHWTDNTPGTADDIHTVRTQNNAFDNFLYAAYEAYAAMVLPDRQDFARLAEEDFGFALDKFRKDGFDRFPHIMEHSYNSSESLTMAAASWSASMLYKLTGESRYSVLAAEFIDFVLQCQQTEPLADGTAGFFYRNTDHRTPVHFIHQSRDMLFAQALALICQTQPQHADYGRWMSSVRLYAGYLKGLMQWTAPYGMVPSGVHKIDEFTDADAFNHLHIFAPADAPQRFVLQLQKGVKIDDEYYIKRFPAWFNIYNGNNAIILSTGKAAAICGNLLGDEQLRQIGLEQLYWLVGKNPLGQSLIFGEGWNYPQMNSFSSGEITGEIPVGIRSFEDEDEPYFPNANNACYKEVWVSSAARALSLIAEINY